MSRLAGIALALAVTVACGATPREVPAAPEPAPPRDRLYVRDGEVVKVIDVATGVTLRTFGAGVTAPDWSAHHIVAAAGANTSVRTIDPVSGKVLRATIVLPGAYGLPNA